MTHQYQLFGQNIVIDGASGAIHLVDDLAYDAIKLLQSNTDSAALDALGAMHESVPQGELAQTISDLRALEAAGQLFSSSGSHLALAQSAKLRGEVKALCLHVAHTCNLTCNYCFAREGQYQGARALMSYGVGKKALDFLIAASGARYYLEVDFFGGEPLMNWDVVKQLVAYGRSLEAAHNKRFRFTLTTNGMLLNDEIIAFANEEMENVVLSLDGRREVHDHFRKTAKGHGSYDIVVPKFQALVQARQKGSYYIRGTFTARNLDFVTDILHMAELGFKELSLEPVVADPSDPVALNPATLPEIFAEYERLALEMAARGRKGDVFSFYHYNLNLEHGPCAHKRLVGCGSGTEYLAVTPEGDLYPCHQFVGSDAYKVGTLDHGITAHDTVREIASCNVFNRPACADCWAKLFCGGGCAANAYHMTGSIQGVDELGCAFFKKRLECAIWLKTQETLSF